MPNTKRYTVIKVPAGIQYATVRGDDEVDGDSDVVCRFADGQKYDAVKTTGHMHGPLADMIAEALSPNDVRTACDIFIAPATLFKAGVSLDIVLTAIQERAEKPEQPFHFVPTDHSTYVRNLGPTPPTAIQIEEALNAALEKYPEAEGAITFLSIALGHQIQHITPKDIDWAKGEIVKDADKHD